MRADRGSVAGAAVGELCSYQQLRGWIDELEFAALNGDYEHQNIVIPNEGQSYLEAAAVYCQAFESFHLQAASGSKFCYTYVSTQVEAAEDATQHFREQGEIGENTYCFYLTTVFVPENDYASTGPWRETPERIPAATRLFPKRPMNIAGAVHHAGRGRLARRSVGTGF